MCQKIETFLDNRGYKKEEKYGLSLIIRLATLFFFVFFLELLPFHISL
jgi:hypothetical protein